MIISPYVSPGIKRHQLYLESLLAKAEEVFGVSEKVILSKDRRRQVVEARQALMYALHRSNFKLHAIGKMLNRDHTTVMYGIEVVKNLQQTDKEFAEKLNKLIYSTFF